VVCEVEQDINSYLFILFVLLYLIKIQDMRTDVRMDIHDAANSPILQF
jgi:hypothetical protein